MSKFLNACGNCVRTYVNFKNELPQLKRNCKNCSTDDRHQKL